MDPKLYVVATPIGNPDDITLRALKVLKEVDFVICEEYKPGSKLLRFYEIKKPLELLNEHNEKEQSKILLDRILIEGKSAALISDAGTPLFADPGNTLVWQCHQNGIPVIPIPGASSIMAALMGSGLPVEKFLYYGFLPANTEKRLAALKNVPTHLNVIFLEAPYRLKPLLRDFRKILGNQRQAIIAYKLTQSEEKFYWGNLKELAIQTQTLPKGEFVFILKKLESNRKRK
ncbi:MAG: 16S rRNA (cytidine(1402)-2'-O)-methyltransferase [Candidatus Cloacimonetes bacterium]|nr:16S rRNA (cytidine(1402)-2'-O)-methyltransferase [Candidatus Cloacimonadota bacterium]MCF7814053.1 16S rRNA (cytidine(1402)-2'-O)-methyltransferase [Candidatus Cloacimonadota bacterium]MCF7868645.1 16S rRNA (cytidine(1402)-2'-O)-methyltransferase [Candidatus Cloacimonadota bacterium]MCF7884100.1 16S rRNA (cytidine(1402)-2'-O)-methyltransferase [Candidatus Cloacimonadota bacterium]